jgi:hypothetical protein
MVVPDPAEAPVMLPEMVPIVHAKVDGALAVSARFGLVLLQTDSVGALVTAGVGFTVNVAVNGAPAQPPVVEVGVIIYCTVPAVELLGLVSVWLIADPEPAAAPVMPPVMAPIVHAKLLGAVAVSVTLCATPLQTAYAGAIFTAGVGFTVTVIVNGEGAAQLPVTDVGVTRY